MGQRSSRRPPPSTADAALAGAVPGRQGACRLCFEGGGELIAPCLCRGTSKWIHRECLNSWRVSGSNPRALTNCCECGFQYRLRLERNDELSSEGELRRRQFMRSLASQTVMWFVGLQLVVGGLGCIIRIFDSHEALVRLLGFHQSPGHEGPGTFLEALKYHKSTYYFCGLLVLLAIVGFSIALGFCCMCCSGRRRGPRPDTCSRHCNAVCQVCCPSDIDPYELYCRARCCEDCAGCCATCCESCTAECTSCEGCTEWVGSAGRFSCGDDLAGMCVGLVVLVVGIFVVVGLFAAIMALVTAVQKAGQEFARIQQMRAMAAEYVVQDLADPSDLGDAAPEGASSEQAVMTEAMAPSAPPLTPEDARVQAHMERELSTLFGGGGSHTPSAGGRVPAPGQSQQATRGYESA